MSRAGSWVAGLVLMVAIFASNGLHSIANLLDNAVRYKRAPLMPFAMPR